MTTQNSMGDPGAASALAPGAPAPDFVLQSAPDEWLRLSEVAGPVVLVFYPADWSPVCGDELSMFQSASSLFDSAGASIIALSVDGPWSHVAFRAAHNLDFDLLADNHPQGGVARAYGVYREADGICERALFVLDADHVVRWSEVSPIAVSPGVNGALAAVEALS